jgi:hypothetical protein
MPKPAERGWMRAPFGIDMSALNPYKIKGLQAFAKPSPQSCNRLV